MTRPRLETEWIRCHSGDAPHGMAMALECQRCGEIQKVVLPMAADLWIALAKAFRQIHRQCKEPGR